ncbi:DNA-processing protein DprA [uncultured Sphaerotilus sp.]|uniref:DNA-processing protein DprA n=1 Tax=uncultured Sphaerotilus sp. TaxID=474984 RepID=UPI0030CA48DD
MADDELAAWLRLLETPGIGRQRARRLLLAFGGPREIFEASPAAWREVLDGHKVSEALAQTPEGHDALVARTAQWLQQPGCHLLLLGDPQYPAAWMELADPPLLLHARGRLELLGIGALAVVGSRHPTPQGADNAYQFAAALSQAGMVIVSGLAQGIDGAAHEGALSGPSGTIAIVGTGLDRVYPRQHHALAGRIATEGLIVSEHVLGTPPLAPHFPQRNRLIAGLGRGTLVVEAALQSGSLITARLAMESNREVFAIPGSIHSPQVKGCHQLIKSGAKLVETTQDILDELHWGTSAPVIASKTPVASPMAAVQRPLDTTPEDPLLEAMGWTPVTLDALQARTGLPTSALNHRLLELELDGHVVRLPGPLFRRQACA